MKYFQYSEFMKSKTAEKEGLQNWPSTESECFEVFKNIEHLVENILDPLRFLVDMPIYISSGYRTSLLNSIVGGSKNSQHLTGKAADITCGDFVRNYELAYQLLSGIKLGRFVFDQVILERIDRNVYHYGWIHVSYDERRNRNEIMECYKGEYKRVDEERLGNMIIGFEKLRIMTSWTKEK